MLAYVVDTQRDLCVGKFLNTVSDELPTLQE